MTLLKSILRCGVCGYGTVRPYEAVCGSTVRTTLPFSTRSVSLEHPKASQMVNLKSDVAEDESPPARRPSPLARRRQKSSVVKQAMVTNDCSENEIGVPIGPS